MKTMGSRHSSYKKLEEEHEFIPSSSWQKKQQKDEAKDEVVPEASSTEQTGQKAQQSEGAKVKEDGEKK